MLAEPVLPVGDDTVATRLLDSEDAVSSVERMAFNHFGDLDVLVAKLHRAQLNRFFTFGAHAAGTACPGVGSHNVTVAQLRRRGLRHALGGGEVAAVKELGS